MAFTRKMLAALGIEADKIDEIITAHTEVTSELKSQIDELKSRSADTEKLKAELESARTELSGLKKEDYKAKYESEKASGEKLKKEYDDYKNEQAAKTVRAAKETAYREILKDAGIPEKHYAKIIKYSDIDGIELDDKGKATNAKDLLKSVKEEWGDHVETVTVKGTDTPNPPANNGGKPAKTKEEIMQIKDASERQKAIIENREQFGF